MGRPRVSRTMEPQKARRSEKVRTDNDLTPRPLELNALRTAIKFETYQQFIQILLWFIAHAYTSTVFWATTFHESSLFILL